MHIGKMRRAVIRFGGNPPTGSQQGYVNSGIPGPVDANGGLILDGTGSGGGWEDEDLNQPTNSDFNTISQTWSKLALDAQSYGAGQAITAIAIAPDSAVHSCDLWFGGSPADTQRHRLSPGNPLIMDMSDFRECYVTPVRSLGRDDTSQAAQTTAGLATWLLNHLVWDSGDKGQTRQGTDGPFTVPAYSWPLRLELYFDGAKPVRSTQRATYSAVTEWILNGRGAGQTGSSANSEEASLTVCVDGRSRFDVLAWMPQARTVGGAGGDPGNVTIRVYGGDSYPQIVQGNNVPPPLSNVEDWIAWDELDAGTVLVDPVQTTGPGHFSLGDGETWRPVRYSFRYDGNPYTFLKVIVELPHGVDPGQTTVATGVILVNAWDRP